MLVSGSRHAADRLVTVSRIGRKYLYVASDGRELRERYDAASGLQDSDRGVRAALYTLEQYDQMNQRTALYKDLREAGIEVRHEVRADMSTDTLRALLAAVRSNES